MKIIFFGSDDFAAQHLQSILDSSHEVLACVTQPDRRQGRGMKVVFSPIKELALKYNLSLFQPDSVKEESFLTELKCLEADVFVVVAYGQILTQAILDMPKIMCINVHGSLLPKYRGAAPIHWAIINGETETGVTVQKMVRKLDAGDIIAQATMPIDHHIDAVDLRQNMMQQGAKLLVTTLNKIQENDFTLTPQNEEHITYASKLSKYLAPIDWNDSAENIYNKIRGLKPWPGSYFMWQGKRVKVLQANIGHQDRSGAPGTIIGIKDGIEVVCESGVIIIENVHEESSNPMKSQDFIHNKGLNIDNSLI